MLPTRLPVPPQLTAANKDYALNKIGHVLSQIDVGTKEARAAVQRKSARRNILMSAHAPSHSAVGRVARVHLPRR